MIVLNTFGSYTQEDLRLTGIYGITNRITPHIYIGSTAHSFRRRWGLHRNELNRGAHKAHLLQEHWIEYGEDAFEFTILQVIPAYPRERLLHYEWQHANESILPLYNAQVLAPRWPPKPFKNAHGEISVWREDRQRWVRQS